MTWVSMMDTYGSHNAVGHYTPEVLSTKNPEFNIVQHATEVLLLFVHHLGTTLHDSSNF